MKALVPALLGALLVVVLWQGACELLRIPPYLVPRPHAVWDAALEDRVSLTRQALRTLQSAALGLAISSALAVLIAIAFTLHRGAARAAMPALIMFRSAPVVAIAPIIMLITGRGIGTSVVVVTIVTFFPMLISFMRGLAADNRAALELLRVYGASRWQLLWLIQAPFALPYVFTGLRVAGASALLGAMLSEWITGSPGLGYLILESGEMRNIEQLWAGVIIAVLMSLLVFRLTAGVERRMLRWKR
jgi:ABC-type nitrate/sulfonate/bicarbonate transport system permease component